MKIDFLRKGLSQISPFLFRSLFFVILFFNHLPAFSKDTKKSVRSFAQTISVRMNLVGDLNESYQFDGILGDHLLGAPAKPTSLCENKSRFSSVIYRQKKMVEVWVDLTCTLQGQKIILKPHRFFVEIKPEVQTIEWPAFDEKIKKLSVQIQELVIKTPKAK